MWFDATEGVFVVRGWFWLRARAAICSFRMFHTFTGGAGACFWVDGTDGADSVESPFRLTSPLDLVSARRSAARGVAEWADGPGRGGEAVEAMVVSVVERLDDEALEAMFGAVRAAGRGVAELCAVEAVILAVLVGTLWVLWRVAAT